MPTQIAVRLPDKLVKEIDGLVRQGAGPRASIVARALNLYLQQLRGEQDARILKATGDYSDFDELGGSLHNLT